MVEWKVSEAAGTVTSTDERPEAERDLASSLFSCSLLTLSTSAAVVTSLLFN